jgi:2-polyprenyl-3-methyl-5-hydroxy-6-metoxy-1,4-benzoquinol methylase
VASRRKLEAPPAEVRLKRRRTVSSDVRSVRAEYQHRGVDGYYRELGTAYSNPHEARVIRALHDGLDACALPNSAAVLDLCCGSGEVTLGLRAKGFVNVEGLDPFTSEAYARRTGQRPLELDFAAIAEGALEGRKYDLVVCSYALHLATPSRLPRLVWQLSRCAPALLVLSPHKRPRLRTEWGFAPVTTFLRDRVHVRLYRRISDP